MPSREWAIERSSGRLVYIGELNSRFLSLSGVEQERFNIRNFQCQFCLIRLTARSLGNPSQTAHFLVGEQDKRRQECPKHHYACNVAIDERTKNILSAPHTVCSDLNFVGALPIVHSLDLGDTPKPTNAGRGGGSSKRVGLRNNGRSNQLATLVYSLISNQDIVANEALHVTGCDGSSYGEVFQNLSEMRQGDRPKGSHVFYGNIDHRDKIGHFEDRIEFILWMKHYKERKSVKVTVYTDNWKTAHKKDFLESLQRAQIFRLENENRQKKAYMFIFWVGSANPKYPNNMIVNEYKKVHIVATHFLRFKCVNLGIETISPTIKSSEAAATDEVAAQTPTLPLAEPAIQEVTQEVESSLEQVAPPPIPDQPSVHISPQEESEVKVGRNEEEKTPEKKRWYKRIFSALKLT
ncbi:hypothetical protein O5O45_26250 [Hahella aquimaris]|uniref:hypothetical protein n=1 Tax=Hahella sp. HNIBRBA332 TaxID=3015983 RepID=UPI00273B7EA9|nr:hypothetical protein [Hahella sp. HNIBRBA332]WLQ13237.1 hypothetical protein O5O45_26250 [Hahella sp. HNIBRBA332]